MVERLSKGGILCHSFVIGELALGRIPDRARVLGELNKLPLTHIAFDAEVIDFIGQWSLVGSGIGFVDAHLLAAVKLTPDAQLWTRDRRLAAAAQSIGVPEAPG